MNIEQLEYICMVAKTHSITTAAEQLYVTQQTISKAMNKLETELDVCLLNRSHKGVTLTPEGENFVEQANEIVDRFHQLYYMMRPQAYTPQLEGTQTLFTVPYVIAMIGSGVLATFHKKYPKVRLEISEKLTSEILTAILDLEENVGIITAVNGATGLGDIAEYTAQVDAKLLYEDELQVFVSKNSKLAKKTEVKFQELEGLFAGYGYSPGIFRIVEQRYGVALETFSDSSNIALIGQMVTDNLAFGVVTKGIAARDSFYKDFVLLSLDDHPRVQVYFLSGKEHQLTVLENLLLMEVEKLFAVM